MHYNLTACDLDIGFATCCCAGFGLCRQKIRGSRDSIAFLAASGTLVYRKLEAGETVTVDSSSVVAIEESVSIGIAPNGRFCACLCGGEGCFSTTLTGPGKVFMQVRIAEAYLIVAYSTGSCCMFNLLNRRTLSLVNYFVSFLTSCF